MSERIPGGVVPEPSPNLSLLLADLAEQLRGTLFAMELSHLATAAVATGTMDAVLAAEILAEIRAMLEQQPKGEKPVKPS